MAVQNIMKLGHNKRAQFDGPADQRPPIHKFRAWQLGVVIFVIGKVGNFISFGKAGLGRGLWGHLPCGSSGHAPCCCGICWFAPGCLAAMGMCHMLVAMVHELVRTLIKPEVAITT